MVIWPLGNRANIQSDVPMCKCPRIESVNSLIENDFHFQFIEQQGDLSSVGDENVVGGMRSVSGKQLAVSRKR
jgi:hypothetical protein